MLDSCCFIMKNMKQYLNTPMFCVSTLDITFFVASLIHTLYLSSEIFNITAVFVAVFLSSGMYVVSLNENTSGEATITSLIQSISLERERS